jgi:molybdate transport system substrate-binding protein
VRAAALAAVAVLAASGCGDGNADAGGPDRARLVVSAAASMTEALEECAPAFGDEENMDVRLSFAGSDELAGQIRQGLKPDVFAAASTRLPEELYAEGLVGEPEEFATNELVLAVPADSRVGSLQDLTEPGVTLAVGSPSVPIGSYTRETLARLPAAKEEAILANVRSNEPDVKGIVGKLVQGAVDAGFVYVTDVNAAGDTLRAIELPPALEPDVTYAAAVVDGAPQPAKGRAFVDGLARGTCAAALESAGFGPVP